MGLGDLGFEARDLEFGVGASRLLCQGLGFRN